ncbi:phosphotransferase enzyme family protein [Paenibacillus sp. BJ-4]|uniref:phosphotransferase enzyme family protein n=1 Tax=Paenibacillus sp. BJ-4 TaxID=2878097 RepID=UPI001CF0B88D|nr:phosphotransferase [Paenibacillus sp. BJ-4]
MTDIELIQSGLKLFFVQKCEIIHIINNSRSNEKRYISFAMAGGQLRIVIKMYSSSYVDSLRIHSWQRLADIYWKEGVVTPQFLPSLSGKFAEAVMIEDDTFYIWVEEYIASKYQLGRGIKLEEQSLFVFKRIGQMKGKMHRLAFENQIKCDWVSPWRLYEPFTAEEECDENYTNALWLYNSFKDTEEAGQVIEEIWSIYNSNRRKLKEFYDHLPTGQVQGDFSPANFIVNPRNSIIGIYDYNLSGSDAFISDCIQEGIFLAYECYETEWFDDEHVQAMDKRFEEYIKGYTTEYPLCDMEFKAIPLLYSISRPIRFDKIALTIKKYNEKKFDEVNERLLWMRTELNKPNIT